MTEKNPDNPFPESDDNPSFEDVSSMDENDVTVILPEELTEDVGSDFTEEIPPEDEKPGEVFVLLPDGDDSQIPMVETQEVTEEVEPPRLTSAYDSSQGEADPYGAGRPTASQVGLRSDNPLGDGTDTEIEAYGEPTEIGLDTERPTETMSAGDLDDFANEVADDMLVAEGTDQGYDDEEPVDYDDGYYEEAAYEDDEDGYEPEYRSSSSFKKVVLSLAALIAIAATGVHFFPGYFGLDPSFKLGEFVGGLFGGDTTVATTEDPVTLPPPPPDGGGTEDPGGGEDPVPTLAQITQDQFMNKFRLAIELGFGEVPR